MNTTNPTENVALILAVYPVPVCTRLPTV